MHKSSDDAKAFVIRQSTYASMKRSYSGRSHPVPPIPSQPMKHSKYVFVGRLLKSLIRQLDSQVEELIVVHARIIGACFGCGHSYFLRGS